MNEVGLVLLGAVTGFFGQFAYYHFIEKHKLRKEMSFSFQKDMYFLESSKLEEITKIMATIDTYILDKKRTEKSFSEIIPHITPIESMVEIYFKGAKPFYKNYMQTINQRTDDQENILLKQSIGNTCQELIGEIRKILINREKSLS